MQKSLRLIAYRLLLIYILIADLAANSSAISSIHFATSSSPVARSYVFAKETRIW